MITPEIDGDFITYKSGQQGVSNSGSPFPTAHMRGEFEFKRHKDTSETDAQMIVDAFIKGISEFVHETYNSSAVEQVDQP